MKIDVTCQHCRSVLRVAAEHAGKQVRCPNCDNLSFIQIDDSPSVEVVHTPESSNPGSNTEFGNDPTMGEWTSPKYDHAPVHRDQPVYIPGHNVEHAPNFGRPTDGKDTTALVVGGVAIGSVFFCACFTIIVTPILATIGYSMANSSNGPNRGVAKATNLVAFGLWGIAALFWVAVVFVG